MEVRVRDGDIQDLPFVLELSKATLSHNIPSTRKISPEAVIAELEKVLGAWKEAGPSFPMKLLILEEAKTKTRIGFLTYLTNQFGPLTGGKQTYVVDMAISPSRWGKFLWRHLFDKLEAIAKEQGDKYIVGMITASNPRSMAIAKRRGYQVEMHQVVKRLE